MNATPWAALCMSSLVNPSLSLFLHMDDGALCSCCETPRWPVLLYPLWTNFSIFLSNITVLSDESDDSQITTVYHHASPEKHVHETTEQRIMGKTSEGHISETHLNRWGWRFHSESTCAHSAMCNPTNAGKTSIVVVTLGSRHHLNMNKIISLKMILW